LSRRFLPSGGVCTKLKVKAHAPNECACHGQHLQLEEKKTTRKEEENDGVRTIMTQPHSNGDLSQSLYAFFAMRRGREAYTTGSLSSLLRS
jgi:hypothetical protein